MSRVDDDRDEARMAARLAEQRRAEESRKKERTTQDSQFSKLVGQQKETAARSEKDLTARSAIAAMLESSEADEHAEGALLDKSHDAADAEARGFRSKLGQKSLGEKVLQGSRGDGQRAQEAKLAGDQGRTDQATSRGADQSAAGKANQGRSADAKAGRDTASDRASSTDKAKEAKGGLSEPVHEKDGIKTDADKGGGGGKQQGGDDKKGGGDVPAGFRFNPALMAPVPVAKKSNLEGSDRLRRIAAEIAQKIVEKVRIGTNALGAAEFQIDLRSNVLSGLSVKVSAKNGKISAVFSGSDREVLKMLRDQEEALKGALSSRGLTLETFKVEAKA